MLVFILRPHPSAVKWGFVMYRTGSWIPSSTLKTLIGDIQWDDRPLLFLKIKTQPDMAYIIP